MRSSTIFKSRWMALVWAAGIIWVALDVAGPGDRPAKGADHAAATDITGATITDEDAKNFADAVNGL